MTTLPARQPSTASTSLSDPRARFIQPPWAVRLLGALGRENGKPMLMSGFKPPTAEQKNWIRERTAALEIALKSDASEDEAKAISLAKLQSILGNAAASDDIADVRAEVYLDLLAEFPAWAVRAATSCWMRGDGLAEDDDPKFVPKPVQLIRLIREVLGPLERQRGALTLLLEAK